MEIKKIKLVYFSPTGTTRKVVESIAQGIDGIAAEHIDLTIPFGVEQPIQTFSDELVIFGAPVYGGRLPADAINRFRRLKGDGTLAVPVVVYGNREFEDSLLELNDLAVELGFKPVAGGAFIGEHSFATEELPIANGRPDSKDVQAAILFGARIRQKIAALHTADDSNDLQVPGRFPYEGGPRVMAVSPLTNESACTLCGMCASVCPVAAIAIDEGVTTKTRLCIRCCACVKNCPTGARVWEDSTMQTIAKWLNEHCSVRKEPKIFGLE
jgi:ferredoxin